MKKIASCLVLVCFIISIHCTAQKPFTPGNIVVYRVGDGGSSMLDANATKVFLDEYSPAGALVQSITMPFAGQKLTSPGNDYSVGMLTLSNDGKYLAVPGYNAVPGINPFPGSPERSIALVDFNGTVSSITTLANPNLLRVVSAATDNGSNLWVSGGDGVEHATVGSSATTKILNYAFATFTTGLTINTGQIHVGHLPANGNVRQVSGGLATTSGQTATVLPGMGAIGPMQFAFADLDPAIPGSDVLYVAATRASNGGIRKYSLLSSGAWADNGVLGSGSEAYTGLAIKISSASVTVFATRQGQNSGAVRGGELISFTDNSGHNHTIAGSIAVIASATTASNPDTKAFRGIALVPQPAPYTAGNLVVFRVGDGTPPVLDDKAAKVYLDEYTISGTLVQSILMPVSDNKLTFPGNDFNGGLLTLSNNGKFLAIPGFNTTVGTNPFPGAAERSIALVDFNGVINNLTVVPNPSLLKISSAATDNGTNAWYSGGDGVEYVQIGSTTATKILNYGLATFTTGLSINTGQIHVGHLPSNGNIRAVSGGLATAPGQTATALSGLGAIGPLQFAFADLDQGIPGFDVLYVAASRASNGGIRKYSLLSNGTWADNGVIGSGSQGYTGLAIKVSGSSVIIFATRQGNNTSTIRGGELVKIEDNSGYNNSISGSINVIASATTSANADTKAFRGVALVPQACQKVKDVLAVNVTSSQATITWSPTNGETNFEYQLSTSPNPSTSPIVSTNNSSVTFTALANGITYFMHIRTRCAQSPSEWSTISFVTSCKSPVPSRMNIEISSYGHGTVKWNSVFGAVNYEYNVSTDSNPPVSGTSTTDTLINLNRLNAVTTYYVHVRTNCGNAFSEWSTKSFSTACFLPQLQVTVQANKPIAYWNEIKNAKGYEVALTATSANPVSGFFTSDTTFNVSERRAGSLNYFHVRAICKNGAVSAWRTVDFRIKGISAYPNPVIETLNIRLNDLNPVGKIRIYASNGNLIKDMQASSVISVIDAKSWQPGIYFIKYSDSQMFYTVRIVKLDQ